MEAQLTQEFGHLTRAPESPNSLAAPAARIARSATVVGAIYLALVVGSPLIVRYGPSADDHAMAAFATRMEQPRCATSPEFGHPCGGTTLATRAVRPAEEPDDI
jgi:hypothetical protein